MYTAEEIQARLREKPFRPFKIIASEGLRYDIRHPDLVLVGRYDLMIGFADPVTPTIYNGVTRAALSHVVALEDLPPQASPATGNTVATS